MTGLDWGRSFSLARPSPPRWRLHLLGLGLLLVGAGTGSALATTSPTLAPFRIGGLFPMHGMLAGPAHEEWLGVEIAREFVDADGGVAGRPIVLDLRDLAAPEDAKILVDGLRRDGAVAVVGGFSSGLSVPAAAATSADGLVYWEAGAVADQVTGQGRPRVFRVGATGANLGANSARFALGQLAPRLGRSPTELRATLVVVDDDYGRSVADAARATLVAGGARIVGDYTYDPSRPDFAAALAGLRRSPTDVLVLVSHVPDGVAFRRAMLAASIHVGALVGSTMAECGPDFGDILGPDAVGVFASDRPGPGFDPATLPPSGRALYDRFAAEWRRRTGGSPTEEGLSGFSAAWVLFHDVLPRAAAAGHLDPDGIAAAARSLDLPEGSLPNGAGVRFASDPAHLGQNLRAVAVVWQWQGVRRSVVVYPPAYARGRPIDVPLPR